MAEGRLPEQLMARADIAAYFQKRAVLVTGGLGFVGSNLVHALVELGAAVTVLDNLHEKYGGNLFNLSGLLDQVELHPDFDPLKHYELVVQANEMSDQELEAAGVVRTVADIQLDIAEAGGKKGALE